MKNPVLTWMDDGDEWDWDLAMDDLKEIINKFNPKGGWHVEVKNFGWRKISGYHNFKTTDPRTFLHNILPHTDNHFRIFKERSAIKIQNYHHDSPTGDEWYTITKNNRS